MFYLWFYMRRLVSCVAVAVIFFVICNTCLFSEDGGCVCFGLSLCGEDVTC